jgi:TorA maturation chaperone TorD
MLQMAGKAFIAGKSSGQIWGNITGEIKRYMEFYGLSLNDKSIIPDHISLLFEFMEKIIRQKVNISRSNKDKSTKREKRNKADVIQKEFFLKYIDPWVDIFFNKIKQLDPHLFYGTVVSFNRKFIELE